MRIRTLNAIINALFIFLLLGLFYIQIIKAPVFVELAKNNRIRIVKIMASRGRILDRNGRILAGDRPSFDCVIIPQELHERQEVFPKLSGILRISADALERNFDKGIVNPFTPVVVAGDISKEQAIAVQEERLNMRGVFIDVKPVRDYVYGELCAHTIGYIGKIAERELQRLDRYGYRMNDLIGKDGVEREYDSYLRGQDGGMQIEVDSRGRQIRVLGSKQPRKGKDICLTIDIELQQYAYEEFGAERGACVVMDVRSGEVLALASKPAFDPNLFISADARVKKILKDRDAPMLNRAISCAYPPGSVFKPVVAAAALEENKINAYTSFLCDGRYKIGGSTFRCWQDKGHGSQNMIDAMTHSCNVFFYNTGLLAGPDTIAKYAQRFGFGRPTGIDLPGETAGLVPSKLWKRLRTGKAWYDGETVNYAIGQGYLLATPVQVLRMASVIAGGGALVEPHVVKKIDSIDVSGEVFKKTGLSGKNVTVIKNGMQRAVQNDSGTGIKARIEGISIAGKTGTAQTGRGTTHAWFAGFAPAENPRVALVVFLEEGGRGGLGASVLAGKLFKKAQELGFLR